MSALPFDIGLVLIAHAIGDYVVQSDWMSDHKTSKSVRGNVAALAHGATYTLPFTLFTTDWLPLLLIGGTHYLIDHWRLARYLVWAKNWLAPIGFRRGEPGEAEWVFVPNNPPWRQCRATGYPPTKPAYLAVWLMIIADNVAHVCINIAVLWWWIGSPV